MIQISGVFFLIYHINKCRKIESRIELEEYMEKFGTFFDEFYLKDNQPCLFYLIFVLRRCALVMLIMFVSSPIAQLCISFIISLTVSDILDCYIFIRRKTFYKQNYSKLYSIK